MKRNPLIPFALIAVLGIVIMFVFSFEGLYKSKELAEAKKNGGKTTQAASKPEDIVKQNCTSCHGDQLQGAVGPNLQKIGGKLSKDEIKEVISKGKGNMPPNLIPADQASKVADWLAKKK
ncbi:cytochrome C [Bacillus cereus]|uniref:Cytochrome c n=1 Tax=Bacillus arachidis TaxID=2819290 RepID=A0ABS3P103_9BACI|nr:MULTISPECIES: cytochrome c [Bacillus]PGY04591.1 cytochrome C [Bacillus cereus]MBO1626505.1 cytochrome c [Bacillus arachidis]PFE05541.1 cytochrome C [Bacillus sp. AFS023182]WIY60313.1 cytochrome c [Bacillus arachidis]SDY51927.1 cytochrome c550 [Bacillus sp. 166amftsu]